MHNLDNDRSIGTVTVHKVNCVCVWDESWCRGGLTSEVPDLSLIIKPANLYCDFKISFINVEGN